MYGMPPLHLLALLAALLGLAPSPTADDRGDRPPDAEGPDASVMLREAPERFVPLRPRSAEEVDRLDALQRYAAARALEAHQQWSEAIELLEQARERTPGSVAVLRRLSRLYFGLGGEENLERAVEVGLEAVAADPEDPETIRRLVRYDRATNDEEAAESLLRSVLDDPDLAEFSRARLVTLLELGRLFADREDYDAAVEPFEQLIRALDSKAATQLTPAVLREVLGEGEADAYRRIGEALYNAGRYDLAITALRRSLIYDPDSPQTPLYLAQALLREDRADEALALLDPIVDDRPPGRVTFDVLAQVLTALGREEEILGRLERAAEASPDNILLRYALAERFEEGGRVDDARRIYEGLSADHDPQGLAALAESLRGDGKYEELLKLLETNRTLPQARLALDPQLRLIGTDPQQAEAVLDAGLAMLRAEPPRLGTAGLDVLSEIAIRAERPDLRVEIDRINLQRDSSPRNYLELADSLIAAGLTADAVDTYEALIARHPDFGDDSQLLSRLAELQFDAGRVEESLASARKILERQPADLVATQIAGLCLQRLGRFDEAIALFEGVPERFAGNPEAARLARIWLANAYASSDRFEQGEAILQELLDEQPDDPWINNDLGYLWAERGLNLERAEAMIRKAVEADPSNSAYLDSLGWVLYKQGEFEEALDHLQEAVEFRASATNLDHLGDALYSLERADEARETWQRALELAENAQPPDPSLDAIREKLDALDEPGRSDDPDSSENP